MTLNDVQCTLMLRCHDLNLSNRMFGSPSPHVILVEKLKLILHVIAVFVDNIKM